MIQNPFRRPRGQDEPRRCYRRRPDPGTAVELLGPEGPCEARVVDLSFDGIALELAADAPCAGNLEHRVLTLRLRLPKVPAGIEVEALVVEEQGGGAREDGSRRLGLRFRDRELLLAALGPGGGGVLNRRRRPRLPSPASGGLPLVLDPRGLDLRVLVRDASLEGLGFAVDAAGREALGDRERWTGALRLPGAAREELVTLELRHLTRVARGHRVGARFHADRSRRHSAFQGRMAAYLEQRRARLEDTGAWRA